MRQREGPLRRTLKAALILTGSQPYTEFLPETLAALCELAGFIYVGWTPEHVTVTDPAALDFFEQRIGRLLPALPNDDLRRGFEALARSVMEEAARAGGMEVPYYRLAAMK